MMENNILTNVMDFWGFSSILSYVERSDPRLCFQMNEDIINDQCLKSLKNSNFGGQFIHKQ